MFDHVKFGVNDHAASKTFFLKALEPLGAAVVSEGRRRTVSSLDQTVRLQWVRTGTTSKWFAASPRPDRDQGVRMKRVHRRYFLLGLSALLAGPLASFAQPPRERISTVGWFMPRNRSASGPAPFCRRSSCPWPRRRFWPASPLVGF